MDIILANREINPIQTFDQTVAAKEMSGYCVAMLNRQLLYTAEYSRFYRAHLANVVLPLGNEHDLQHLPFTTPQDLREHGADMVCGGGGNVKRIVTLHSTGTDGLPKRLYFSEGDLRRTVDFFAVGMRYLCSPGDRIFLCMPTASENGIGQLLAEGLAAMGAIPYPYGVVSDYHDAASTLREAGAHTVVGIPAQIRKLALLAPDICPANVLLSADYVSQSAKETIARTWGCEVFTHFGMTETGYGCAVECPAHMGQHIRHDELLLEIIAPDGADAVPEGQWGEIVVTTLRRESMPLIRYRTGDMGRLLRGTCGCGSRLERLDHVLGRIAELSQHINIYRMDELLLARDEILDYHALLDGNTLSIMVEFAGSVHSASFGLYRKILAEEWPDLQITIAASAPGAFPPAAKRGVLRI
ncbi:MAG: AMP-binding protein [Peptococcaceae bacterium]|jgi:phenylacetate-coenzyme A ligase PaaK-like adenylate-forming protein|nr:AMP-binding protein [Peptococcaceae bacterium]